MTVPLTKLAGIKTETFPKCHFIVGKANPNTVFLTKTAAFPFDMPGPLLRAFRPDAKIWGRYRSMPHVWCTISHSCRNTQAPQTDMENPALQKYSPKKDFSLGSTRKNRGSVRQPPINN